ncbi:hypothetical protein STCU_10894 [Strigomonas culicis]|uniref:Uncharacterized protein n=1 Tax=Strigomonas culicis TaxID=28005 RepID=S9UQM5_9TRYP|nr:hypothetical protein STCU_10894 [Strigomonas culicis]|eukprot:EPY16951.1 hypothetical protein STCU_10894 [Strigomonas culicis]
MSTGRVVTVLSDRGVSANGNNNNNTPVPRRTTMNVTLKATAGAGGRSSIYSRIPFAPFDLKAEYYGDSSNWNQNLPVEVLHVIDGATLEPPFTTLLWTQGAADPTQVVLGHGEDPTHAVAQTKDNKPPLEDPDHHYYNRKLTEGYYSCIRCGVPLFDPAYQIDYTIGRGWAAFQYVNADAVTVEIVTVKRSASLSVSNNVRQRLLPLADTPSTFEFHVRCAYCNAFVGTTTRDVQAGISAAVKSGELFLVNSCGLLHMAFRTNANLKGVIAEEPEEDDGSDDETGERFEDNEIFKVEVY